MLTFPRRPEGTAYLTEGGTETELMYKFGHELPHFAIYPLLDDPAAVADLHGMYRRYLEVAERHGLAVMMGGLDYRASPDWAERLGYSRAGLAEMQHRAIDFLREAAAPFRARLPAVLVLGVVGPRGDAYGRGEAITATEAEDYHGVQLETLAAARVDGVWAATFNNVPEAVGVARAAAGAGLPLNLSFTLDGRGRLASGPSLREAIETVDAEAGAAAPDGYGINCSHPLEFEPALEPGDWIRRLRSLRPNAARMDKIALCKLGHLEEGDPPELGRLMGDLARRYPHVDIWGGCCGSWETHLEEIARNVRQARGGVL
ncbi:homocysteine S-methyltransferase family protein [Halomonas koreensis]|uniref:Homocysteine S-methyltransferase family protein n=1 Tax=Halomonas koreensis TaxID=245385 RepID=A0ABU1FYE2_9GAMM|nr:homocysteine S-methyltransferase family protein [Halomonas koreensis]MDR5865189.1 homocysteine S-methyltransferase family protein [Halomonas koreensis]